MIVEIFLLFNIGVRVYMFLSFTSCVNSKGFIQIIWYSLISQKEIRNLTSIIILSQWSLMLLFFNNVPYINLKERCKQIFFLNP